MVGNEVGSPLPRGASATHWPHDATGRDAWRGWWDLRAQPLTETDVWQLHELHAFVKSSGSPNAKGNRLAPTIAGMEPPQSDVTWARVVEHLGGRSEPMR